MKNRAANAMTAKYGPMKRHENVVVFGMGKITYNPQLRKGKPYRGFSSAESKIGDHLGNANSVHKDNPEGLLQPISTLEYAGERGQHPTQKPIELMRYLIRTYTNPGDTVLDPCCGSGTTGVAAMLEGRKCVLIEREEKYLEITRRRISEYHV